MTPTSMQFYADESLNLKSYGRTVFLCLFLLVSQAVSIPFCTTLDLQLSFYRSLCYNSRDHCPLLQCLRTTSAILAGAQPYFVVSLFKCEGENSCDDLIPNPCILMKLNTTTHTFFFFVLINFSIIICIKVRSYTCPVPLSIGICFVCVEMFSNGVP